MQLSTSLDSEQVTGALHDAQNAGRVSMDVTLESFPHGEFFLKGSRSFLEWCWFMASVYARDPSATFNGIFFDHITGPEFHVKTGGLFL